MGKSKQTTAVAAALVLAVLAVGGTGVAAAVKTVADNVETEFDLDFSPRALSREKSSPIASSLWWTVRTRDGLPPPALREFRIKSDRDVDPVLTRWPVCRLSASVPPRDVAGIRKACGPAIVGTGRIVVGALFPDDQLVPIESELLVVNGGKKDGVPTLYAYAFLQGLVDEVIVVSIEVKNIRKGRFGTESIASIPEIVGGDGLVTYFRLDFKKGVLRATCTDRRLWVHSTAVFMDNTKASAGVVDPCTPRD